MDYNTNSLRTDIEKWKQTATTEDINTVLELGYPAFCILRSKLTTVPKVMPQLPVIRGQIGESEVENILRKRFINNCEINNVTKNPKSGDLTLNIAGKTIIIEVKNYTNPVPTMGIEKFRRDLNVNNINGGIFISLHSPITGITKDFTIQYESTDSAIIPVVYIVSNRENEIITAVSIIISLINATSYINKEIQTRDTLLYEICNLGDQVGQISQIRNNLQTTISDINNQLLKITTGLVSSESIMRRTIESLKSEFTPIYETSTTSLFNNMQSIPAFTKQSTISKKNTHELMTNINNLYKTTSLIKTGWKLTAKKCLHCESKIEFIFAIGRIEVCIPRTKFSNDDLLFALDNFNKKITIKENVILILDTETLEWINKHILIL